MAEKPNPSTSPATKSPTNPTASTASTGATTPSGIRQAPKPKFDIPKGFVEQSQDVVGFYDPDVDPMIQFTPTEAVLSDSQLDPTKVSILIFGILVKPCMLVETSKSGNVIEGKVGDQIGIWGKQGMRALANLCGQHVIMYPDGEKDTGKPNPMMIYRCLAQGKGKRIPIVQDRREKSKMQVTWLDSNSSSDNLPF